MGKDYYESLGLKKGASEDEIKRAYKKLAKKYHPDVSSDKDAEHKFKEVAEAYSVLSDAEKKQNYDNYGDSYKNFQGYEGFGGFGRGVDIDFEDIFNSFAGAGFGFGDIFGGRNKRDLGSSIKANITLTFEEAAFGTTKEIKYERIVKCKSCKGTGAEKEKFKTCTTCNGQGRILRQQKTPFGIFQSQTVCHECRGRKEIPEKVCPHCHGKGLERDETKLDVKIPAGINTGNHLRVSGKGNEGNGGIGDLFVVILVEPHEVFKRDEADLYAEIPVSFTEAALGATIEVPTLKGKADLKVPSGTQTGTIFKMKGKGIQKLNSSGHGDEYIKVIVETPDKLNKKQKELLKEFAEQEKLAKKRKGFFKKIFGKF